MRRPGEGIRKILWCEYGPPVLARKLTTFEPCLCFFRKELLRLGATCVWIFRYLGQAHVLARVLTVWAPFGMISLPSFLPPRLLRACERRDVSISSPLSSSSTRIRVVHLTFTCDRRGRQAYDWSVSWSSLVTSYIMDLFLLHDWNWEWTRVIKPQ